MFARCACVVFACFLCVAPALAGDGVIEINQAAALKGGVTPGDAPLFPVTLSEQGSYRLTSNLDSPLGTIAIEITATMVTLDLGGFVVRSTNTCTGYPTSTCAMTGGNAGIRSTQFLTTVRNGSVSGIGGVCVYLIGASSEVDQLRVLGCGGDGITVGSVGRVTRSFSGGNYGNGIFVGQGGSAAANEGRANTQSGILISGGLAVENRAFDNWQHGISVIGGLASRNLASGNNVGGFGIPIAGLSHGDNVCNGVLC